MQFHWLILFTDRQQLNYHTYVREAPIQILVLVLGMILQELILLLENLVDPVTKYWVTKFQDWNREGTNTNHLKCLELA